MAQPTAADIEPIPPAILERYRRATSPARRMELLDGLTWKQVKDALWGMDESGDILGRATVPTVEIRALRAPLEQTDAGAD